MTAQYVTDQHVNECLADVHTAFDAAHAHVAATALRGGPGGQVGLELEYHLVDARDPARRPGWPAVQALLAGLPELPGGSRVTVEPGGQIELSTPPALGVAAAVAALRGDEAVLRAELAAAGYRAVPLGTDPARPLERIHPGARYVAMERHFAALGCAGPGRAMMTGTAALQVNLDAGPEAGWAARLSLARSLAPVLVAISACSPYLAGRASGWASMRQQAWHGLGARSAAVPGGSPTEAWADHALAAPVLLVRDGGRLTPVSEAVPFADWLRGTAPFARRPELADLEYHLTTLFPPIRPRGYLELRCLDSTRWWPALAGLTATLLDDPVAADAAAEAAEPVADRWTVAARDGLRDPALRAAAIRCVSVGAHRCPAPLAAEVGELAELVLAGRTPGDEIAQRIAADGPLAVLGEDADAG